MFADKGAFSHMPDVHLFICPPLRCQTPTPSWHRWSKPFPPFVSVPSEPTQNDQGFKVGLPDMSHDLHTFAVDQKRESICCFATFNGTHTGGMPGAPPPVEPLTWLARPE